MTDLFDVRRVARRLRSGYRDDVDRTEVANYSCPTCNIPYCSLTCFRADVHRACAEPFAMQSARQNLSREDITVDEDERRKTLEILWRLETGEGVISDEEIDSENGEYVEQPSDRETEELLKSLSINDRQRFQSLLKDPSKAARMYFEEGQETLPWWKQQNSPASSIRIAQEIEKLAAIRPKVRADLRYNVLAVLLAYTYTLRHLEISRCSSIGNTVDENRLGRHCTTKDSDSQLPSSKPQSSQPQLEFRVDGPPETDSDGEPPPLEDDYEVPKPSLTEAHWGNKSASPEDSLDLYPVHSPVDGKQRPSSPPDSTFVRENPSYDSAQEELRDLGIDLLHRLIPVLFANPRKNATEANVVLSSVTDATLYFLQAINPYELGTSVSELLITLLKDVRPLISPESVRLLDQVSLLNLAMSDLYTWVRFEDRNAGKKLAYYAYSYDAVTSQSRNELCHELDAEINQLENEREEQQRLAEITAANATVGRMDASVQRMATQPKIQLLE